MESRVTFNWGDVDRRESAAPDTSARSAVRKLLKDVPTTVSEVMFPRPCHPAVEFMKFPAMNVEERRLTIVEPAPEPITLTGAPRIVQFCMMNCELAGATEEDQTKAGEPTPLEAATIDTSVIEKNGEEEMFKKGNACEDERENCTGVEVLLVEGCKVTERSERRIESCINT